MDGSLSRLYKGMRKSAGRMAEGGEQLRISEERL